LEPDGETKRERGEGRRRRRRRRRRRVSGKRRA